MKKALSILMSVLIIALSFTFIVGAEANVYPVCDCKDHKAAPANSCYCCVYCPNLDTHHVTTCVKNPDNTLKYYFVEEESINKETGEVTVINRMVVDFCCKDCDGIYPCNCKCECCPDGGNTGTQKPGQILTPEQQGQVIDGFQGVLSRIREFFDKLFDMIFEFLRFDEVMGNN